MERRIIRGFYSEKIYDEIGGSSIQNNEELADVVEKYLEEDDEWKGVWLTEGMQDYAKLFINDEGDAVFLLWTIDDELYLIDISEIPKNREIAEWFVEVIANYLRSQLFPPKKFWDVKRVSE